MVTAELWQPLTQATVRATSLFRTLKRAYQTQCRAGPIQVDHDGAWSSPLCTPPSTNPPWIQEGETHETRDAPGFSSTDSSSTFTQPTLRFPSKVSPPTNQAVCPISLPYWFSQHSDTQL